jgi:hypothetical protein
MEPHIIKSQRVRLGQGLESTDARPRAAGKKHVRTIEHDGAVRAIELTCSCGEISRVELVIETSPKAEQAAPQGAAKGRP